MDIENKLDCFLCKKPYTWTSSRIQLALGCHLKCALVEKQIEEAKKKVNLKSVFFEKQIEKAKKRLTDLEYRKFLICQK